MDEKRYRDLLLIVLIIWVAIPTLSSKTLKCNDLVWFVALYSLGGYFQKYGERFSRKSRTYFVVALISYVLLISTILVIDFLGLKKASLSNYALYFTDKQNVLVLLIACGLFCAFKNLNIKNVKAINSISATTFGIYLITEHPLMREYLWKELLPSQDYLSCNYFVAYSLLVCLIVFVLCALIDYVRIKVFNGIEKLFRKAID